MGVGNTTRDSHVLEQTGPATEQRIASPSKNSKEAKEFLEPTGPATEQLVASSSKKKKKGQTVLVTIVPDMEQPSASPGENITEHHRMTLMTGISLITEAATEQPFASMWDVVVVEKAEQNAEQPIDSPHEKQSDQKKALESTDPNRIASPHETQLEEETVLDTKEAGSEEPVSFPRGNNGKAKEVLELIAPVSEKLIVPSIQKDKQDEKVLETTGAAPEEPLTCPRGDEAKETWVLEVTGPPVTGQEISSPNENNTSEQKG